MHWSGLQELGGGGVFECKDPRSWRSQYLSDLFGHCSASCCQSTTIFPSLIACLAPCSCLLLISVFVYQLSKMPAHSGIHDKDNYGIQNFIIYFNTIYRVKREKKGGGGCSENLESSTRNWCSSGAVELSEDWRHKSISTEHTRHLGDKLKGLIF